jgi:hypothetical protein
MSILEHQECLSLYWDRNGKVYGLRAEVKNAALNILDSAVVEPDVEKTFTSAASELIEKLAAPSAHLIVMGGALNGSVCFDLAIPPMPESDIREAIQYELTRYIPCDMMEIAYGYRIIRNTGNQTAENAEHDKNTEPVSMEELEKTQVMQAPESEAKQDAPPAPEKLHLRIFAVLRKEWNEFIAESTMAGLKFDAFLFPYQVLDPLLSEYKEIFIPDCDAEFKFVLTDTPPERITVPVDSKWEADTIPPAEELLKSLGYENLPEINNDGDLNSFVAPMLNAAYALSKNYALDRSHMISLPKELIPERFRVLKTLFAVLISVSLILILALFARFWWSSWSKLQAVKNEQAAVEDKIVRVRKSLLKLKKIQKVMDEIHQEDIGNPNMAYLIYRLSSVIPKSMWMQNMNIKEKSAVITVKSPAGKQSTLLPFLNNMKIFKVTNSNTKRFSDGTENILVTLEFKNKIKPPQEHKQ